MQDAEHRPEEGGPSLIVEHYNNTGGRQRRTATKLPLYAPVVVSHVKMQREKDKQVCVCESERLSWWQSCKVKHKRIFKVCSLILYIAQYASPLITSSQ